MFFRLVLSAHPNHEGAFRFKFKQKKDLPNVIFFDRISPVPCVSFYIRINITGINLIYGKQPK